MNGSILANWLKNPVFKLYHKFKFKKKKIILFFFKKLKKPEKVTRSPHSPVTNFFCGKLTFFSHAYLHPLLYYLL